MSDPVANALRIAAPNDMGGIERSLIEAMRRKAAEGNPNAQAGVAQHDASMANPLWGSSTYLSQRPVNSLGDALQKVPPEVMFLANFMGPKAPPPRVPNPIKAYHGSPHDFDKFDLSKIGTGEGAQAYGFGHYFAENEGVARSYRDALSGNRLKDGTPFNEKDPAHWAADAMQRAGGDRAKALEVITADMTPDLKVYEGAHYQRLLRARALLEHGAEVPEMGRGKMYEVAIHATPDQFLDWDKPLSQQSEAVRNLINEHPRMGPAVKEWAAREDGKGSAVWRAADELTKDEARASEALKNAGIPGIRYLDQGSRGAGHGTSNFVVFDPSIIEILRKYGLLGPIAAGAVANSLGGDGNQ